MIGEGPFREAMEGRAAPPPSAVLLGWELLSIDPDAGTIEVAFAADDSGQIVATATAAIRAMRP